MKRIVFFTSILFFSFVQSLGAAPVVIEVDAADLVPRAELFFSPQSGSFLQGAMFEVPIYINTKGSRVNAIELHVRFDANKLRVMRPSGDTSIIGLWVGSPSYDNTRGTLDISGTIPGGITTDSGRIITITFQTIAPGQAAVSIANNSQVLLNDGLGTPVEFESNRGIYTVVAKPPDGPAVFSDTHSLQNRWYKNPNPVISWDSDSAVEGYSYILDTIPTTEPGNVIVGTETSKAYQNLGDSIWYFHIKAQKRGIWGATTHFAVHIDTAPPAQFTPTVDYLGATVIVRYLVSFFTTDNLSGIDHYEVGIIDKSQPTTVSPVFVPAESPYQIPFNAAAHIQVMVRAFDKAGNVREGSINISAPFFLFKFLVDYYWAIGLCLFFTGMALIAFRYFWRRHNVRKAEVKEMISSDVVTDHQ